MLTFYNEKFINKRFKCNEETFIRLTKIDESYIDTNVDDLNNITKISSCYEFVIDTALKIKYKANKDDNTLQEVTSNISKAKIIKIVIKHENHNDIKYLVIDDINNANTFSDENVTDFSEDFIFRSENPFSVEVYAIGVDIKDAALLPRVSYTIDELSDMDIVYGISGSYLLIDSINNTDIVEADISIKNTNPKAVTYFDSKSINTNWSEVRNINENKIVRNIKSDAPIILDSKIPAKYKVSLYKDNNKLGTFQSNSDGNGLMNIQNVTTSINSFLYNQSSLKSINKETYLESFYDSFKRVHYINLKNGNDLNKMNKLTDGNNDLIFENYTELNDQYYIDIMAYFNMAKELKFQYVLIELVDYAKEDTLAGFFVNSLQPPFGFNSVVFSARYYSSYLYYRTGKLPNNQNPSIYSYYGGFSTSGTNSTPPSTTATSIYQFDLNDRNHIKLKCQTQTASPLIEIPTFDKLYYIIGGMVPESFHNSNYGRYANTRTQSIKISLSNTSIT